MIIKRKLAHIRWLSQQLTIHTSLPKDIWLLILHRRFQQSLHSAALDGNRDGNKEALCSLANHIGLPQVDAQETQLQLSRRISEILTNGGVYNTHVYNRMKHKADSIRTVISQLVSQASRFGISMEQSPADVMAALIRMEQREWKKPK